MKTGRAANKDEFAFLELNDGTTPTNLQALVPASVWPIEDLRHTGACVLVEGVLKQSPPEATGQVGPLTRRAFASARPLGAKLALPARYRVDGPSRSAARARLPRRFSASHFC